MIYGLVLLRLQLHKYAKQFNVVHMCMSLCMYLHMHIYLLFLRLWYHRSFSENFRFYSACAHAAISYMNLLLIHSECSLSVLYVQCTSDLTLHRMASLGKQVANWHLKLGEKGPSFTGLPKFSPFLIIAILASLLLHSSVFCFGCVASKQTNNLNRIPGLFQLVCKPGVL